MAYRTNSRGGSRAKVAERVPKLMISRYRGTCATCRGDIEAGASIYAGRADGKSVAWHEACYRDNGGYETDRDARMQRERDERERVQRDRDELRERVRENAGRADSTRWLFPKQLTRDATDDRLLMFDTFGEFVDHAENVPQTMDLTNGSAHQPAEWSGALSVADAINKARAGFVDARPIVETLVSEIETDYAERFDIAFVPTYDVSGAEVDIDRYLMGEPENMIEYVPAPMPKRGRVVRVLMSAAWPSTVSTDTIQRYGATIVAFVEILHKMNLSPDIWIENCHGAGDEPHSTLIHVHNAADPLDIDDVMFAICHPAMQRRLMFRVQETLPTRTRRRCGFFSGYGAVREYQCAEIVEPSVMMPIGTSSDVRRIVDDPAAWIADAIESVGMVLNRD
jgi:hypothetical protein